MNPSKIVRENLIGLRYYPKVFPNHIWDNEFEKVDIELFSKAIKYIRSNEDQFPTYSKVRTVMNDLRAKDHASTRQGEYDRTPEDESVFQQRRGVFWKWKNWINSFDPVGPENLMEYYLGCAKEYEAIGGDAEYMEYVNGLYASADLEKQKLMEMANDQS